MCIRDSVYGVVTFYTFFTMTPKGKHPISVCMGTACYVRGSEKLLEEFKRDVYKRQGQPLRSLVHNTALFPKDGLLVVDLSPFPPAKGIIR